MNGPLELLPLTLVVGSGLTGLAVGGVWMVTGLPSTTVLASLAAASMMLSAVVVQLAEAVSYGRYHRDQAQRLAQPPAPTLSTPEVDVWADLDHGQPFLRLRLRNKLRQPLHIEGLGEGVAGGLVLHVRRDEVPVQDWTVPRLAAALATTTLPPSMPVVIGLNSRFSFPDDWPLFEVDLSELWQEIEPGSYRAEVVWNPGEGAQGADAWRPGELALGQISWNVAQP